MEVSTKCIQIKFKGCNIGGHKGLFFPCFCQIYFLCIVVVMYDLVHDVRETVYGIC